MTARPTRVALGLGIGAIALFAVGTDVGAGWLLVLSAMLLGTLATGALLPFRALLGIQLERRAPQTAWAGDTASVSLVVFNESRSTRGLILLEDHFLGGGAAVVTRLGPGEHRTYQGLRTGLKRGVHTSAPCVLVTGAPFGVVRLTRRKELPSRTVVYPRVVAVSPSLLASRGAAPAESRVAHRTPSGDTASVREYRPGDPLRHVHWRSTARRGALVVREFEDATEGDVLIVADAGAREDVLDTIASAVCSVALIALSAGRRVRVVCSSENGAGAEETETPAAILEWGARLEHAEGVALADALVRATADTAGSIVCALEAVSRNAPPVDELARLARAGANVAVVLVPRSEDRSRAASCAGKLLASGATVRVASSIEELEACSSASAAVS